MNNSSETRASTTRIEGLKRVCVLLDESLAAEEVLPYVVCFARTTGVELVPLRAGVLVAPVVPDLMLAKNEAHRGAAEYVEGMARELGEW